MKVLVTGGAGYIGSHTLVELLHGGYEIVVIDNLRNSSAESLKRVERITGRKVPFYNADCTDRDALNRIFDDHQIDAAIHFAGLKSVGESASKPLEYYKNNIDSTLCLCDIMQARGVKKLIFSSSANIYGQPEKLPLTEESRTGIGLTNPYGQTKFMIEQILRDISVADPAWEITLLRYFNPVGAHESGLIGEDPNDIPNNLLPYISQVAVGKLDKLLVFGDDYDTPDGTGVRDYIHVVDLAKGHVAALQHLYPGVEAYNLGTGKGTSVLEAIRAFEKAAHKKIAYTITARRPGDLPASYADCSKAIKELGWKAEKTFEQACADAWHWQSQNPNGYEEAL